MKKKGKEMKKKGKKKKFHFEASPQNAHIHKKKYVYFQMLKINQLNNYII